MEIKNIHGEVIYTVDSDTLVGADLTGANLTGVNLINTWGNFEHELNPVFFTGLQWGVQIYGDRMRIGCQDHPIANWVRFSDSDIIKMDGNALTFWKQYKDFLLLMCEHYKEID